MRGFTYGIAAIPTRYAGVDFRSRLEARWAAFFDLCTWSWEYEPVDLKGWTPDFRLNLAQPILVEVKPVLTEDVIAAFLEVTGERARRSEMAEARRLDAIDARPRARPTGYETLPPPHDARFRDVDLAEVLEAFDVETGPRETLIYARPRTPRALLLGNGPFGGRDDGQNKGRASFGLGVGDGCAGFEWLSIGECASQRERGSYRCALGLTACGQHEECWAGFDGRCDVSALKDRWKQAGNNTQTKYGGR